MARLQSPNRSPVIIFHVDLGLGTVWSRAQTRVDLVKRWQFLDCRLHVLNKLYSLRPFIIVVWELCPPHKHGFLATNKTGQREYLSAAINGIFFCISRVFYTPSFLRILLFFTVRRNMRARTHQTCLWKPKKSSDHCLAFFCYSRVCIIWIPNLNLDGYTRILL